MVSARGYFLLTITVTLFPFELNEISKLFTIDLLKTNRMQIIANLCL
jgi:hypothetical protein